MSIPEQIQALIEAKFDELMLSLQAGQIPIKLTKAVKIEGFKIESPTHQLNISKSKMIEIYNEIPILFQAYAIPVDWTIDSYQHPSSPPLLLHAVASSNYWIIPTLIIDQTIYWLVPNPLRQIRLDKLKHLGYLFEYPQINPTDINSEFHLVEPGNVSYYFETGVAKWKLEQPGKLAVTSRANAKYDPAQPIEALQQQMIHQAAIIQQLQQKFDAGLTKWTLDRSAELTVNQIANNEAAKTIEALQQQIVQQAATIQQLQEQVVQQAATIQQLEQPIRIRLSSSSLSKTQEIKYIDDYDRNLNPNQYANPNHSSRSLNTLYSSPRQPSFINDYNQDSRSFYTKYVKTEVLEEEQNIEGRRSGRVRAVNLSIAPHRRGGYWVFDRENQLMLVPSSEVRINKFTEDTISAMFDYSDFSSNYRQIQLIEPAIVEPNAAGGYQLVRRRRIEFE
jgi:hypothetical protein